MQQPDLGKRIAKLRKSKELTQDELADQCGINVRTLQRIESGAVLPRSYTVRLLSQSLDAPLNGVLEDCSIKRTYRVIRDLSNLKTHTMAKVSVLGAIALTAGFFWFPASKKARLSNPTGMIW